MITVQFVKNSTERTVGTKFCRKIVRLGRFFVKLLSRNYFTDNMKWEGVFYPSKSSKLADTKCTNLQQTCPLIFLR